MQQLLSPLAFNFGKLVCNAADSPAFCHSSQKVPSFSRLEIIASRLEAIAIRCLFSLNSIPVYLLSFF